LFSQYQIHAKNAINLGKLIGELYSSGSSKSFAKRPSLPRSNTTTKLNRSVQANYPTIQGKLMLLETLIESKITGVDANKSTIHASP